jgi:hypothetical protein
LIVNPVFELLCVARVAAQREDAAPFKLGEGAHAEVEWVDVASLERERRPLALVARLVGRLWLLQGSIFVAMEVAERLGSGSPIDGAYRDHLLIVGLAVQLVVALAGAVLLLLLHRTAVVIVAAVRRLPAPQPPRSVGADSTRISAMPLSPLAGATGVRGPPPA